MDLLASWGAMVGLGVTWLLWAAALVGIGGAVMRALAWDAKSARGLMGAFWVGMAVVVAFLQVWHLVLPVDGRATLLVLVSGWLLALPVARRNAKRETQNAKRTSLVSWVLGALLVLWVANRATGPETFYDSGLYHQQALQWAETYPIVPGLANLHYRLGFNSGITLLAAMMDQGGGGPWRGNVNHVVNGFFLAALAVMIAAAAGRIVREHSADPTDWLTIFFGVTLTDWGLDVQAASLSTDLPTAAICLAAAIAFLEFYARRRDADARGGHAVLVIALGSLAAVCKGSAIPLSGCLIALTLAFWWRTQAGEKNRRSAATAMLLTLALLPCVWMVRNAITSGYPLFPSEGLRLPVDWQMPVERVHQIRQITRDWNTWESFDSTVGHWRWIGPWFEKRLIPLDFVFKGLVPMCTALLAGVAWLIGARRVGQPWRGTVWLMGSCLVAAVAWFFAAPAPRLGSQIFQILAAAALVLPAQAFLTGPAARRARTMLLVVAALWLAAPPAAYLWFHRSPEGAWATLWLPPAQNAVGLYPRPLHADLIPKYTAAGLRVWTPRPQGPTEGDYGDRVWDATLPAAPASELDPQLRLRHPPDLAGGFTVQPQ